MQPSRHGMRNNSGLALDLPSTIDWASTRRCAWAQALPTQGDQPPTPVVGAAHTLAVDGRHLAIGQGKGVLHPVPKALLEPGRMQPCKVPPQRIVRGNPVRQCQEGAQPLLIELAKERDDRQHRQHQDVRQVVPFGAVDPRISSRVSRVSTRDEGIGPSVRSSSQAGSGTVQCRPVSIRPLSPPNEMQSPWPTALQSDNPNVV